ncbi:unnamed protein product [Closterium sp. Yama58-4]|nr:unnamed protein product [Closterium sp. Yama58-4]
MRVFKEAHHARVRQVLGGEGGGNDDATRIGVPVRLFYYTDVDGKVHMMDTYIEPLGKVEMRLLERRKKEFKLITPSVLLRIPGGSSFFSSGANYAAFEHRSMMQIMPLLVADESALKSGVRESCVLCRLVALLPKAFPTQVSHWKLPKIHMIRHLLDNIVQRGMPHHYSTEMWERTHKDTVKGPVRGSNWSDIPRRIVEEVQREVCREVAVDAGGGRQYAACGSLWECVFYVQAIKTKKPVLTKKCRTMRIGGLSDPVYDEYVAALGDEMKGMAAEFTALGLATNNVPGEMHTT